MRIQHPIRIVVEDVVGNDGVTRYKAGYELDTPGVAYSNVGWAADSPEEGLLRCLNDELDRVRSLAQSIEEKYAAIHALIIEIEHRAGVELSGSDTYLHPTYTVTREWGSTRIERAERDRNELQERLMDLHRCQHHRLCLDECSGCHGPSVGGPACAIDDQRLWKDKAAGIRR